MYLEIVLVGFGNLYWFGIGCYWVYFEKGIGWILQLVLVWYWLGLGGCGKGIGGIWQFVLVGYWLVLGVFVLFCARLANS